jgi:O-antigen/teichoic acid export membrane protein
MSLPEPPNHPRGNWLLRTQQLPQTAKKALTAWKADALLGRVLRNTGYLFSANTISTGISSLQGFLSAALLGPAGFGLLGMIVMYASSVNRLLSFRMGDVVVRFAGQYLATGKKAEASVVIKTAMLIEASVSVIAYLLLVLTAPIAAQWVIKDTTVSHLIILYGIALLGNFINETSTAVLQVSNHFRVLAGLNLAQSLLAALWVVAIYVAGGGVQDVLLAYLAGKLFFGLGTAIAAMIVIPSLLGPGWISTPFRLLSGQYRNLARFAVSTNLGVTLNLVLRDSEVLWVGYFLSTLEAGYYKFALAVMSLVSIPVNPLVSTTFPEITRVIAQREWQRLRRLLRRTTIISAAWTIACLAGIVVFGPLLLPIFKNGAYLPAFATILILLTGYGIANIFYWNRPLLLALGEPNFPLKSAFIVGVTRLVFMFLLVRTLGYNAQAALLAAYFTLTVGWNILHGLQHIHREENPA